MNLEFIVTVA